MRIASFVLALLLLPSAACRRDGAAARDTRERAYRENNAGVAWLEQFNYAEAAGAFRRALGIDRTLAVSRLNLSLALLYSQDLAGAALEAQQAMQQLPDRPQPPYVLGLVARAENRTADARAFFERVLKIDPHDPGTNINLGQLYLADRQYAQATDVLQRAVDDEPYNVTAVYNLGLASMRSGKADEGRRLVERSQTLREQGYAITFGTGYLEQGRYAEALASTGLEPDLVDLAVPSVGFTRTTFASETSVAQPAISPTPFGRTFEPAALTDDGVRGIAAALGGGLTPIDFDRDGALDLFIASPAGQRLFRNDHGRWTDVTAASGLDTVPSNAVPVGCIAADYDNDGAPDLFVLRDGASSLYRNRDGRFHDVTSEAGLPPYPFLPGAAAFVDVDHDGDLDLLIAGLADIAGTRDRRPGRPLVFPRDFEPAPLRLLRNNGNGTFTDVTAIARLDVRSHAVAIAPADVDNRRDIDLLIVNADAPPVLFKNLRDGTFRDVAAEMGLAGVAGAADPVLSVAVGDLNKDDFPDFFFGRAGGGAFALSDGRGQFTITNGPAGNGSAVASQLVDYDNDGLLDLLTWTTDGPHVFRNLAGRWSDVTARAVDMRGATPSGDALSSARALALADVDGDGWTDIVAATPAGVTVWRCAGDPQRRSLRVRLAGLVSNRSAVGAKVQMRAGSLTARLDTAATTPPIAPVDLVFGLGARAAADVVRVLWPSGILQAEVPADRSTALDIKELNRKPSSCPFLFTWSGTRFEFVTDFLGGGELGYWAAPGVRHRPDPIEYVRIRGDQLQPLNGRFEIRVTNELEEVLFLDRLELIAVDHPSGLDVFPNEGMADPPKPFRLHTVADPRVPSAVVDDHGHDVTGAVVRLDRRYPDDFAISPIRGYAEPHTLTIDLGPSAYIGAAVLLLTGWTDYAFSSDNVAAHQAGLELRPPSLEIRTPSGSWRPAIHDIGVPVGRPQTLAIDLGGRLRPGEHIVRLATNMRIYWDQILVARAADPAALRTIAIDPGAAVLTDRGFSAEVRRDGREPVSYDYHRVASMSPWKVMPGRYTREGDVRDLLMRSDDRFVVAKPGDQVALSFDAGVAGSVKDGWTRTFLLRADGFSKEMDINSASPDAVEPLPFHRMTRYPDDARTRGSGFRRYIDTYQSRVVTRPIGPLIRFHGVESR